jgi:hypothetical protein
MIVKPKRRIQPMLVSPTTTVIADSDEKLEEQTRFLPIELIMKLHQGTAVTSELQEVVDHLNSVEAEGHHNWTVDLLVEKTGLKPRLELEKGLAKVVDRYGCKDWQILNEFTGKCVKRTGAIGQMILDSNCKKSEIFDTKRRICMSRSRGRTRSQNQGRSRSRSRSPRGRKCPPGQIMNKKTNRCVKKDGRVGRELRSRSQSPRGRRCPPGQIMNKETKLILIFNFF